MKKNKNAIHSLVIILSSSCQQMANNTKTIVIKISSLSKEELLKAIKKIKQLKETELMKYDNILKQKKARLEKARENNISLKNEFIELFEKYSVEKARNEQLVEEIEKAKQEQQQT